MVDLKEWGEEGSKRASENICKIVEKVDRDEKISSFDLFPELIPLIKNRSWSFSIATGAVKEKESPIINYNSLLSVGLFDCIFIPIIPNITSKNQFKETYCLSREREQGIGFDDFLHLIEEGYLIPSFVSPTTSYNKDFYTDILAAYQKRNSDLPPLFATRYDQLMIFLKKISLACQDNIPEGEGWVDRVTKNHPEYEVAGIQNEIENALKQYYGPILFPRILRAFDRSNLSLNLQRLMVWGFEKRSKLVFEQFAKSPKIGSALLYSFVKSFIAPISYGHFGIANYKIEDVNDLTLQQLVDNLTLNQEAIDILSSSQAASSYIVGDVRLEPAIIEGGSLLHLLNNQISKRDEVKKEIFALYNDFRNQNWNKIQNDIDNLNSTCRNNLTADFMHRSLGKYIVHFGQTLITNASHQKIFTDMKQNKESTHAPMWLYTLLLDKTIMNPRIREVLRGIHPDDIVQWVNRDWIFKDDAIPFTIWQRV